MKRAMLKTLAAIAMGGWLATGPIHLSHGQSTGGVAGGAAGAASAATGGAAGGAAKSAAQAQTPAARAQLGAQAQTGGANAGAAGVAAQRAQAAGAAARTQAAQRQMRGNAQGANNRGAANAPNRQLNTRAGAARTGGAQASSVDNDRRNNPFDSRSNDRFDNRSGASDLFDNDSDDRTNRARSVRGGQRPMTQPGLSRAGEQLDANQRRFEDRTGRTNPGLDTARDRVQSNLDRFDERRRRVVDDQFDEFDRRPILRTDDNDRFTEGAASSTQRSQRPLLERRARFDAGAEEDEIGTGMPDDPRIPDGDHRRRLENERLLDDIDRRARFDAGAREGDLGTGTPDDPRLRNRLDRLPNELNDRLLDDRVVRDPESTGLDRTRSRLDDARDRLRTPADGIEPALSTSADPRLERPNSTFIDDPDVRIRLEGNADLNTGRVDTPQSAADRLRFRDDLDVRRNLSTRREAGFRGAERPMDRPDVNRDGVDDRTIQGRRLLSDWLDRAARGLDSLNERLNARPQTISVE